MQNDSNSYSDEELDNWRPFDKVKEENEDLDENQLAHMYRNRVENGTSGAFRKIGKRRYFHRRKLGRALLEGKG